MAKDTDPEELRWLIEEDGLPYPKRFHESVPQSHHIVGIGQNVKENIDEYTLEMENAVGGLTDFIGDFCFEDHDDAWRPRLKVYRGDTPRTTRRPLKNFLRTVLHIKRFKSDEELEEEERAIRQILARYPDRMIKIYNMTSLISYLAASPGVTVSPSEVIQHLKVHEVESKYEKYMRSWTYSAGMLHQKGKDLVKKLIKCQEEIRKVINRMELSSNGDPMKENVWDKTRLKTLEFVCITTQANLYDLMVAHYEFKLANDDCLHRLVEYLLAHIKDFCKLNPQRQPKLKVKGTSR